MGYKSKNIKRPSIKASGKGDYISDWSNDNRNCSTLKRLEAVEELEEEFKKEEK